MSPIPWDMEIKSKKKSPRKSPRKNSMINLNNE
jgi:hypothetical protein